MTTAGSERHRQLIGIRNKAISVSVEDRLEELNKFDSAKLRAVIKYPGTQKTVRLRAEIFLKRRGKNADKSGG